MKRLICLLFGHRWKVSWFTQYTPEKYCTRCGEIAGAYWIDGELQ